MGKKNKPIPNFKSATAKLVRDVESGECRVYDVSSFPTGLVSEGVLNKSTHVSVAVSGSVSDGCDWMVVCPHRVDVSKDVGHGTGSTQTLKGEYDIDPLILIVDPESGDQSPSGLFSYHQKFDGRKVTIPDSLDWSDPEKAVLDLRKKILIGTKPLEDAPKGVINALHHMANKIKRDPNWPMPTGEPPEEEPDHR